MNPAPSRHSAAGVVAACVGWSVFIPIGLKYPLLLGATTWGLWQLRQQGDLWRIWVEPAAGWSLAFWTWSAVAALWSAGPWQQALAQVGLYSLLLCVPLIGCNLRAEWARRAMQHFCIAAGVVGGLCLLHRWGLLPAPDAWIWRSAIVTEGNQRIVTSLLLALGCALALREALLARLQGGGRWELLVWCAAAFAAAVGLASQDRRTGMVTLPVLLLLLAMGLALAPRGNRVKRSTMAAGAVLCCVALGVATPSVRDRFTEGFGELAEYNATGEVANSWGMRLRMAEQSVLLAAEKPITGHGLGSWAALWTPRVPAGSLLAEQHTPHSEYLLVAVQSGLIGTILLIVALWTHATRGLRLGLCAVVPASLLVWSALAWAGLFNVVLRDAKFALPLLMLAALAWPGARPGRGAEGVDSAAPSRSR